MTRQDERSETEQSAAAQSALRRGLALMRERGLRAKKSFGQNFLHDDRTCKKIAALALPEEGGTVLEIGAGLGALTEPLAARASQLIAIERDRDLVPILEELFAEQTAVRIVEADAVKLDWRAELEAGPQPYVVAGNLPYQITGRLIEKAIGVAPSIARAVFMLQREVADRLAADSASSNYGVLSVFTQAAFSVERAITVSRGAFMPQPKVDSAVVVLTPHAVPRAEETDVFRDVVKRAFGQRRKKLRNSWRGLGELDADGIAGCAEQAGIDLSARAETLAVEDFARMAKAVSKALTVASP